VCFPGRELTYFSTIIALFPTSGVPRNFVPGGGGAVQQIQLKTEDRGSPLVRGSGGSYTLVQEISFHIVIFFLIFGTLRIFMITMLYRKAMMG